MRRTALVLLVMCIPALRADEKKGAPPLTPEEAAKKVNEKCTVEMEVKSTGGRTNYFLNSKANYREDGNFTIFIDRETAEKFKEAKMDNPAEHFKGKTVRVTGTVTLYQGKPQIKVEKPDDIKIVEKK